MKIQNDAYGQEMWALLNGKESYEVVERDDGFIGLSAGPHAWFADYTAWPKHQKQGIKFVKGRVLDVGTGAGRVALYLQKKGHKVTAIDKSPLAIKVCKKRGVKDARVLPIERIGVFKQNTFDSVVMYGNNFGLFANPKKAKTLLKEFHQITTLNAFIIAESMNPYKTDDAVALSYHRLNRNRGRMAGQLKIRIRFRNYISDWFDYLLVSKKEMRDILHGTGWKIREFVDSEKFKLYIAVIEKQ